MSFVDLVGIGVDRIKDDFELSAMLAQLIPAVAFFWFFALSVPIGVLQAKYGKKTLLNVGAFITGIGLILPFVIYSFGTVLIGFAFLGIGNTIVQVSANPLLVEVVPNNKTSSFLSFSQFVKAIGSMLGAPLAAFFTAQYGDWKILFLTFGVTSLLTVLWLSTTKIQESKNQESTVSLLSSFKLLNNGYILSMVLCIFLVVGIDVGYNSFSGQYFINNLGLGQITAENGRSIYFLGRMIGAFLGSILLTKIASRIFLVGTTIISLAFLLLILIMGPVSALVLTFLIGLSVANIFPLVFSLSVQKYPERSSEISGLMMMAVSGGAVIPFIMGAISDLSNTLFGMLILAICTSIILALVLSNIKK
ncbi:MFS transporter [Plebeiibacterium sediminum]|uniref:MFS transporter n=1 Tax=Plebeiibacterium sediminum TaxID=2992112 RepID=A0AAE3M8J0_9BACT|nr:MFS transporter [Plebeiobacterium sediminum]MCW3789209.1 MFS transporter [Plebeiobacterium sediminum]